MPIFALPDDRAGRERGLLVDAEQPLESSS
jgi:hypothetical protein